MVCWLKGAEATGMYSMFAEIAGNIAEHTWSLLAEE